MGDISFRSLMNYFKTAEVKGLQDWNHPQGKINDDNNDQLNY